MVCYETTLMSWRGCRRIFLPWCVVMLYVQKPLTMNSVIVCLSGVFCCWCYIQRGMCMTLLVVSLQ